MILALHGNLGSATDWDSLGIPDVQALNLWEYSHLSFAEFASSISERDDRPILAGYSLGGRLALHAMAAFPDRWRAAVILSAHPGLPCVEDRIARSISDGVWAKRAREMPWSGFLAEWNRQPVLAESSVQTDQEALEPQRESIARAFENWSLGRQEDLRPRLRRFESPVLWITGAEDRKFSALAEEMGSVFPNFRHEVLSDCGHRLLTEPVGAMITSFVSALS